MCSGGQTLACHEQLRSERFLIDMHTPSWKLDGLYFRPLAILALLGMFLCRPAYGSPMQDAADPFQQAQAYEQAQNYPAAESVYRKVLASDPNNPEALKRLGIVEQTELKFDASIEHFKLVLRDHPDYLQANFFLGLSYFGKQNFDGAIAGFDKELKTAEPHPATRYYLALALEATGRVNDAMYQFEMVSTQRPDNADVLYALARLHMDASFRALNQLKKLDPDSFHIHAFMGRLFSEERHFEPAITEFQAALRRQPDASGIHYPLGAAYRMTHQFELAEKEFLLALQESPNNSGAYLYLGDIAFLQQDYSKAIPYLKQSALDYPNDVETHLLLGRCYVALGELQQGKAEFLLAARLDPTGPRSHYFMADVYKKLNQPEDRQRELDLFNKLKDAQKANGSSDADKELSPPQ